MSNGSALCWGSNSAGQLGNGSNSTQLPSSAIPVVVNGSGTKYNFTQNLKYGSTGNEVKELQKLLSSLGYLKVIPNGNFGPLTLNSLKEFQKTKGLIPDGIVGLKTRETLNK